MGARVSSPRPLLLAAAAVALAVLAPSAEAAKPCRPAGFHPVFLYGRALALESADHRIAVCDLKTKKLRQVLAGGTLTKRRGDALSHVTFSGAYDSMGLVFKARRRIRVMWIDFERLQTDARKVHSFPTAFFAEDAGLVWEIHDEGIYEMLGGNGDGYRPEINPSVWAEGLAIGEIDAVDPRGYWLDRDQTVHSSKGFRIGSRRPYPGELDLVAARSGRCAKAGYRLVFANDRARVLRDPSNGSLAVCDAGGGTVHTVASGVAAVSDFATSGHWLVEAEAASTAENAQLTWVAYDLTSGARRVVCQAGVDTCYGMRVTPDGTAVYGVQRAGGKAVETQSPAGARTVLSTQPNTDPASIAFSGEFVYWHAGHDDFYADLRG